MSLWSNRLKKYDEVKRFCFFFKEKALSTSYVIFSQFHMILLPPLSSTCFNFYLDNKHCIYVFTWCCLLHIYTLFWECDSPLWLRWNILPSIYMQSSLQSVDNAVPTTPAATGKSEGGGEKRSVGRKWEKLGKKQSFFPKP